MNIATGTGRDIAPLIERPLSLSRTSEADLPLSAQYRSFNFTCPSDQPSADAILGDAARIYDEVVATRNPEQIVAIGLSLGSGTAAHLASQRALASLILVTPFDSVKALASDLYPWLPVRLLLRHRMDVADALARSSAKVAIIAAAQDEIVPSRRTEAHRRSAEKVVLDCVIGGVGHNDIYDSEEFVAAMDMALRLIEGQTEPVE